MYKTGKSSHNKVDSWTLASIHLDFWGENQERFYALVLCALHPTRSHPQQPVRFSSPQSTTYIHCWPPILSHFLPSFFYFLPLPRCLPVPLPPPQITAVFTRALRDLPTRPRVRSHSPRRAKKNPLKSYQASCLLTHWLPMCVCVDVIFCVCM